MTVKVFGHLGGEPMRDGQIDKITQLTIFFLGLEFIILDIIRIKGKPLSLVSNLLFTHISCFSHLQRKVDRLGDHFGRFVWCNFVHLL